MFKQAIVAAALAITSLLPAQATPNYFNQHKQLYRTLVDSGLTVEINPTDCSDDRQFNGFYQPKAKRIVICQRQGTPGGEQVAWTAGDLNTLRHEAHHFVQDCRLGMNHDGALYAVYQEPVKLVEHWLSQSQIQWIVSTYKAAGASDYIVMLELEAFAVADMDNPLEQIQDIKQFCS